MIGVRADRLDHAVAPRQRRRPRIADVPFAFGHKCERGVIGNFGRDIEIERSDIGISCPLERRYRWSGVVRASARAQTRQDVEAGRVGRVGGDVGNCWQPHGAGAEIGRVGEQCQAQKKASSARPSPPVPCRQMTTKAANANKIASPAKTKAAANVASAGKISNRPDRTIMTEMAATAMANRPNLEDQIAILDTGSSGNGRRAMFYSPAQIFLSAAHSLGSRKGEDGREAAFRRMAATRALVSG